MIGILSLHIILPMLGILVLILIPNKEKSLMKVAALGFSLATFVVSVVMLAKFEIGPCRMDPRMGGFLYNRS